MDFALLPPEVNSARMYSGAGSGPLLAASASWAALAAELHTVGAAYESVIAELGSGWSGPSATAMATAAAPYAQWMHATSAQAEQTAVQAKAAAAAYETAFEMTVPPPVIAANRAQLMALLATNFLGQNTPAIAATEAHYAEMWAQDAAAMYGYADGAALASRLTAFTEPPRTTNPAGSTTQSGALAKAAAASHPDTALSVLTQALQGLTAPATGTPPIGTTLLATLPAATAGPAVELGIAGVELIVDAMGTFGIDVLGTFLIDALGAVEISTGLLPFESLIQAAPIAAGLGQAGVLTGLSVPQAWTVAAASATQPVAVALSAVGTAAAGETAVPIAGMATAGLAGRASAAVGPGRDRAGTTVRQRPPRPSGPPDHPAQPTRSWTRPVMGIDIELLELAELRNAGILSEDEYCQQKRRLRSR